MMMNAIYTELFIDDEDCIVWLGKNQTGTSQKSI